MKRFFQKLLHNCTGAVTVFVTLLLIPAVLQPMRSAPA